VEREDSGVGGGSEYCSTGAGVFGMDDMGLEFMDFGNSGISTGDDSPETGGEKMDHQVFPSYQLSLDVPQPTVSSGITSVSC
jgi:hypothetical protein